MLPSMRTPVYRFVGGILTIALITALLVVSSSQEPVNFDAVLQPSTLHYSISKARRAAPVGA